MTLNYSSFMNGNARRSLAQSNSMARRDQLCLSYRYKFSAVFVVMKMEFLLLYNNEKTLPAHVDENEHPAVYQLFGGDETQPTSGQYKADIVDKSVKNEASTSNSGNPNRYRIVEILSVARPTRCPGLVFGCGAL